MAEFGFQVAFKPQQVTLFTTISLDVAKDTLWALPYDSSVYNSTICTFMCEFYQFLKTRFALKQDFFKWETINLWIVHFYALTACAVQWFLLILCRLATLTVPCVPSPTFSCYEHWSLSRFSCGNFLTPVFPGLPLQSVQDSELWCALRYAAVVPQLSDTHSKSVSSL